MFEIWFGSLVISNSFTLSNHLNDIPIIPIANLGSCFSLDATFMLAKENFMVVRDLSSTIAS